MLPTSSSPAVTRQVHVRFIGSSDSITARSRFRLSRNGEGRRTVVATAAVKVLRQSFSSYRCDRGRAAARIDGSSASKAARRAA